MNEWMVHQLLIIKKERKILFQQQIKKVNTEKKYCMYLLWLLLPKKPSWNILCFEEKKTIFVLTQFLDKNVPPTYLQFFLLLLKNQTINEMNIPPSSYFYELTDKKENNYWKKIPQLLYCSQQFLFSFLKMTISSHKNDTNDR